MSADPRVSRRALLGVPAAIAAGALVGPAAGSAGHRPLALVYLGPACDPGCAFSIGDIIASGQRPMEVRYCGPEGDVPFDAAQLASASLWVQPGGGGDDYVAAWRQVRSQATALRRWVRRGGSYLGICMGAYMAGHGPGYDLLPGNSWEWITTPGATVRNLSSAVIDVRWRGVERKVFFQDGPSFTLRSAGGGRVIARYPNELPAVVTARFGRGTVVASGVHPEADASWYSGLSIAAPARSTRDLADDLVAIARSGS